MNLFTHAHTPRAPLADTLRPTRLSEVVGQAAALGEGGFIAHMTLRGTPASLILWGPPGCGKTTIARLIAQALKVDFMQASAVQSGVAELKSIIEHAKESSLPSLLFVDEIHRFNRAQQDVLLPAVEQGTITLIGATTENPSFEINAALLSRAHVVVLQRLNETAMAALIARAEAHEGRSLPLDSAAKEALYAMADGDGRALLNLAEALFAYTGEVMDTQALGNYLQRRAPVYDKSQESHYNLISALHKSLRGSDADAALYWFARMLDGGEDPMYIARRLIRFAAEDIGLADPQALVQANAAKEAYHMLGTPEGELALAQAVIYLATAPKSNAAYVAYKAARASAKKHGSLMPPKHILNAPTSLMQSLDYGKGYQYDHDVEDGFSGQHYFPDAMTEETYYMPKERGFEREIIKRLAYFRKKKIPLDS